MKMVDDDYDHDDGTRMTRMKRIPTDFFLGSLNRRFAYLSLPR